MKKLLVGIAALAGTACSNPKAPAPPAQTGLEGAWKSDGYGFVVVATGDSLQAYEVTQTTCLPSFTACGAPPPTREPKPPMRAMGRFWPFRRASTQARSS